MPARSILVAAGTQPNTVLGREEPQHVTIDGKYFQAFDEDGRKVTPERITKPVAAHVLMSVRPTAAPSASSATCIRPLRATS